MNKQAIIFLGLAGLFAVAAAWTASQWLGATPVAVAKRVETVPVFVARIDIPVGSAIRDNQIERASWPRGYAPPGSFQDAERLLGRIPRRPLAAGEPVLAASLLPEGARGGLVSVIDGSHRAISVKVDPVIGVAGFVHPGDRVDVLATLRRIDQKEKLPFSKVILQDVRVLAIDQKLEDTGKGDPTLVSVVTLEVSLEDAEKLTYISHEGRLQLALRHPADRETTKTKSVGVADLLPTRARRAVRRGPSSRVEVLRGAEVSSQRF